MPDVPVYAPTLNSTIFRIGLNAAITHQLKIYQLDISNAYVNSNIHHQVYLYLPMFYSRYGDNLPSAPPGHKILLKLQKSLYGLRASGRNFFQYFKQLLQQQLGYHSISAFPCCYFKYNNNNKLESIIITFVDDFLLFASNDDYAKWFHQEISTKLQVKLIPPTIEKLTDNHHIAHRKFLGIQLEEHYEGNTRTHIKIHQQQYILEFVNKFLHPNQKVKPSPPLTYIPLEEYQITNKQDHDIKVANVRSIIGSLLYTTLHTRPDITWHTNYVAKFQLQPTQNVFNFLNRILAYLKGTSNYGIVFRHKATLDTNLTAFTDASHSSDPSFKSSFGFLTFYNDNLIFWDSMAGHTTTMSPGEAELQAISHSIKHNLWLIRLVERFHQITLGPTTIHSDSETAINMIHQQDKFTDKNRYFNIRLAYCRELINELKAFDLSYQPTDEQYADLLTKPLASKIFTYLSNKLIHQ
ncbi:hypothetical protein WICMUC_005475 [Wickerhamomyces mucosus]|uniref:Reverse transcriptase Ty1/copia-type domain-containing protein n=1 Tax=Wickerhamomyces mucosus TaxID=1378264 RepID=A0A9P8P713_9ASCO|nr:hypothetical protein WICMUC_005475 [Wickerhamomyces mucosus]